MSDPTTLREHVGEVQTFVAEQADAPVLLDAVDAYGAHRDAVRAAYGARGVIEELLADRGAHLGWRLQQLQTVQRGALGVQTGDSRFELLRRMRGRVGVDLAMLVTTNLGILRAEEPGTLGAAVHNLDHLIRELRGQGGAIPSLSARDWGVSTLTPSMDPARLEQLVAFMKGNGNLTDAPPASPIVSEHAPKTRAYVANQLESLVAVVAQYAESVQRGAEAFAEALAEDRAWLKEDELEWMLTYERHLAHELRDATRDLERAIARRAIRRLVTALEAR